MREVLLLVFIHGFKGDNKTFKEFPKLLRREVGQRLPHKKVIALVYPKFDTKGELTQTVSKFREWLEDAVISYEKESGNPSPTTNPTVQLVLIGHSMGGIVSADTMLSMMPPPDAPSDAKLKGLNSIMLSRMRGLVLFDTPFRGINKNGVLHAASKHIEQAKPVLSVAATVLRGVTSYFGWKATTSSTTTTTTTSNGDGNRENKKITATTATASNSTGTKGSKEIITSTSQDDGKKAKQETVEEKTFWDKYGTPLTYVGAAGVAGAATLGTVALAKPHIDEAWKWISDHLAYVGCLFNDSVLRQRCQALARVQRQGNIGAVNFYTLLDEKVASRNQGTFCNMPEETWAVKDTLTMDWRPAVIGKATDILDAHTSMFSEGKNLQYHGLAVRAADRIVRWVG